MMHDRSEWLGFAKGKRGLGRNEGRGRTGDGRSATFD